MSHFISAQSVEINILKSYRYSQTIPSSPDQDNLSSYHQINTVLGYIAVALPIVLILSVVGYRQYRIQVLKQQIAKLERMWRLLPHSKI